MKEVKNLTDTTTRDKSKDGLKLERVFGVWDATAHIIGNIIGSGIFVSPKSVLQYAGSPAAALLVWFGTGVISFLGAICYAELALLFPEAGSDYTYIKKGCGQFVAFLFMWVNVILGGPASRGAVSLTFSTYFCRLFFFGCPPEEVPDVVIKIVAFLALTSLTAINCYRMTWVLAITDVLTSSKVFALVVIILAGFSCLGISGDLGQSSRANLSFGNMWEGTSTDAAGYVFAFYGAFWAFSGYANVGNIIEEIQKPLKKNVSLAVILALCGVICVYLLANVAYLIVLTPAELLSSEAVGLTFGQKISPIFFWLIPIFVGTSTLGALNTSIINASREIMAGTRSGHLFSELSLIHSEWLTPVPSLVFNIFLSSIFIWSQTISQIIVFVTYVGVMGAATSIATLIYYKIFKKSETRQPDEDLNIPVIIPIVVLLFFAMCLILPLYKDYKSVLICFAFIATGVPVYFIFVFPKSFHPRAAKIRHRILIDCQKLCNAVPDEQAMKGHFE